MSIFKKPFKQPTLKERVAALEKIVSEEIIEKTISKTTTKKEEPVTQEQILDEWLNGKDEVE